MKRILIALLMVVSVATVYSAGDFNTMAGLNLGYNIVSISASGGGTTIDVLGANTLAIGAFLDFTYLRLGFAYNMTLGGLKYLGVTMSDYSMTFLNLDLVGKYPFAIGPKASIWPAIGFLYSIALSLTYQGEEVSGADQFKKDMTDLYLKLGVGADFDVSENIVLTPSIFYGINLSPGPNETISGITYSGSIFQINLGVGFKF